MCGACQEINLLVVCIVKVENLRLCRKNIKMLPKNFLYVICVCVCVCVCCVLVFTCILKLYAYVCLNTLLYVSNIHIYILISMYTQRNPEWSFIYFDFFWFSAHLNTVVYYLYTFTHTRQCVYRYATRACDSSVRFDKCKKIKLITLNISTSHTHTPI